MNLYLNQNFPALSQAFLNALTIKNKITAKIPTTNITSINGTTKLFIQSTAMLCRN